MGLEVKKQKFKRSAGILLAISSIPSPYGIGTFGKAAYDFVDFIKSCDHRYWQILPPGPISYGDSPYQAYSVFAGNPYYIDLDILVEEGLLTKSYLSLFDWGDGVAPTSGVRSENIQYGYEHECNQKYEHESDNKFGNESYVNYEKIFAARFAVLTTAFENFKNKMTENGCNEYEEFNSVNQEWLDDYALYMACKAHFGNKDWTQWESEIKFRKLEAVARYKVKLVDDIEFWKFCQFEFYKQWNKLKKYANYKGIEIIGDIPIYTALDSADVWANSDLFQLDEELVPTVVAGVPPDAFTELGQKWGNPLYDWETMEKDEFAWWARRMKKSAELYDVIRIDHFIGIAKYYTIPAQSLDARKGEYKMGPGRKLTDVINRAIGDKKIIAENLGVAILEAEELLAYNDYPAMQVLEFAFDGSRDNPHLPYNFKNNSVVYGGTHDNETLQGFFNERSDEELTYAYQYLGTKDKKKIVGEVFRAGYASVASIAIFQVQDILRLDNSARMNYPSTLGNNWKWRLKPGQLNEKNVEDLKYLANIFGRAT